MSARPGEFDASLDKRAVFDAAVNAKGIFDADFATTAAAAATGDTDVQPSAGTRALSSASRRFAFASVLASALLWNAPRDTSGPLAPQPDTYVQPIAGQTALRQQQQQAQRRAGTASTFLWTTAPQDVSGPLATQPDTYVPPIDGVAEFAQAQRSLQARSRAQSILAWAVPADPPILDPYVPDVVGLASIRNASIAYRSRVVGSTATIWTTAQDLSGPLGAQPDTSIQPIEGQLELRQAIAAWRTRAVASPLLWAIAQDQPQPPASDPAMQEIAGLSALGQRARASRVAVGVSHTLVWTLPRDQSGPLATQPDTAIAPIEGVTAIASAQRAWRGRVQASLSTWTVPNDPIVTSTIDTGPVVIEGLPSLQRFTAAYRARVIASSALVWTAPRDNSGPLSPQPDTYIQPVSGTSSLRQSAAWRARINAALPLVQTTAQDVSGPLAAQPDTYTPPTELSLFARRQRLVRARAVLAQTITQTIAADQNGPQPDTATAPIEGLSNLRRGQAVWRSRAAQAPLGWTTAQDRSGPLAIQPDTYVPPIELSMFARRQAAARRRAVIAQASARTFPSDLSGTSVRLQVIGSYAPRVTLLATAAAQLAVLGSYVPVVGTGVHSDWVEIDWVQIDPEWTE